MYSVSVHISYVIIKLLKLRQKKNYNKIDKILSCYSFLTKISIFHKFYFHLLNYQANFYFLPFFNYYESFYKILYYSNMHFNSVNILFIDRFYKATTDE